MWIENKLITEDLEAIVLCPSIPWDEFINKTILVSGATGLIGANVINALLWADIQKNLNLCVVAIVRDRKKAEMQFASQLKDSFALKFIECTVEELPTIDFGVDYIIHGASPTASTYFVEHPVETIQTSVIGTMNLLNLAKEKRVKGFIFLSSMEVYGAPKSETPIYESFRSSVDTLSIRSCYPLAKMLSENLCISYFSEYSVPAKIIRLSQCIGAGASLKDQRIFAECARSVIHREDIVLLTDGSSTRTYLYTSDAVTAILTVLLGGTDGEAYNAANPATYCSVREMAEMVAHELAADEIHVTVFSDKNKVSKYPPPHHYNLKVDKLRQLGWEPLRGLKEMYQRMITCERNKVET